MMYRLATKSTEKRIGETPHQYAQISAYTPRGLDVSSLKDVAQFNWLGIRNGA